MYPYSGLPVRPFKRQQINAGSAVEVEWNSRDAALQPVELDAARWRYDNLTDSLVLQGWTDIPAPDARGTITIPASLNGMSRDYNRRQLNQVVVELTDTAGNITQQLAHVELSAVFVGAA